MKLIKKRLKEYHGPFTNYETQKNFKIINWYFMEIIVNHYNSLTLRS